MEQLCSLTGRDVETMNEFCTVPRFWQILLAELPMLEIIIDGKGSVNGCEKVKCLQFVHTRFSWDEQEGSHVLPHRAKKHAIPQK